MNAEIIAGNLHWFVVGVAAIGLGIVKGIGMFKAESLNNNRVDGEIDVIQLLRDQVSEIANVNRELRLEIAHLREINYNLMIENEKLRIEVNSLKTSVDRLLAERG